MNAHVRAAGAWTETRSTDIVAFADFPDGIFIINRHPERTRIGHDDPMPECVGRVAAEGTHGGGHVVHGNLESGPGGIRAKIANIQKGTGTYFDLYGQHTIKEDKVDGPLAHL